MVWFLVAGPLRDEAESSVINNALSFRNFQPAGQEGLSFWGGQGRDALGIDETRRTVR